MSRTREALVRAVLANPDDDAVRLVFADWFEDQGDAASVARADFIRTQVERARLDPRDPRQSELHAREYRLLAAHAKDWCGSHFAFKKARFRRGFIEYVHLHLRHFQHHRRQLFALEPVRDVSLTGWMRATDDLVRRVAACEEWQHVETLRIHHQGPHKAPGSNLVLLLESPHLTGLKSLRVPMLSFTADARRRFERAAVVGRLEELSLPGFDTWPNDPGAWFADGAPAWANLRTLRVGESYGRGDVLTHLIAMPFWKSLRSLSFPTTVHQTADRFHLVGRHLPPGLESLTVESTSSPITVPDEFFAQVARLPLRRLRLHGVPLSPAGASHLFGPQSALRLKELTVTGEPLTDADLRGLTNSEAARGLESLSIGYGSTTRPEAVGALFDTPLFRSLVSLELGYPAVGPSVVQALAGHPRPHLRQLGLYLGQVPAAVLRDFVRSPAVRSLVRVQLEKNHTVNQPLPADVVADLASLPHLVSLVLDCFPRDAAVADALRARGSLPWPRVRWDEYEPSDEMEPNNLPPLDDDLADLDRWG